MQLSSQAACSRTPTASLHSDSVTSLHSISIGSTLSSLIQVVASPICSDDDDSQFELDAEQFADPNSCEWPHEMPDAHANLSNRALIDHNAVKLE